MSTSNEEQPYNKWEFKWDKKKVLALVITILVVTSMICYVNYKTSMRTTEAKANPQFVLSGIDDYDEYGQGIDYISLYGNSTGAWVLSQTLSTNDASKIIEWNASVGIYIAVAIWYNSTFTGATDTINGTKYLQHSISVYTSNGTEIFNQQNFTYGSVNDFLNPPMWRYSYYVILDFLPVHGEIYTTTITCEVYGVWIEE